MHIACLSRTDFVRISGEWHEPFRLVTRLLKRQFGDQRWSKITSP
jgi:hypothetical protein